MKEFIKKLIERLEEKADEHREVGFKNERFGFSNIADKQYAKQTAFLDAISIVNELAEEYINTSTDTSSECNKALDSLHKKILSNPKMCEIVTEEEIMALVKAKNNGWIPCSEKLPEKNGFYLVTQKRYSLDTHRVIRIETDYVQFEDGKWGRARHFEIIAWQPLPAPYKEGCE